MRANGRLIPWAVLVVSLLISPATASTVSAQTTSRPVNDSVLNGALIGAGVAVASGLFPWILTEPWDNCRDDVGPMLRIRRHRRRGGRGSIDALIRRRRPLLSGELGSTRLEAAPLVAGRAAGVRGLAPFLKEQFSVLSSRLSVVISWNSGSYLPRTDN